MEGKDLKAILPAIEAAAKQRNKKVHDSLYDEMANYLGHRVIRDLEDSEKQRVLTRLGELAILLPGDSVAGGDFRDVVVFVCTDSFKICDDAAKAALDLDGQALRARMVKGMAHQRDKIIEAIRATTLRVDTNPFGLRALGVDTGDSSSHGGGG